MKISNFFAAVFTFIIMLSCVVHGQNVSAILVYDGKVHNYEAEEIKIKIDGQYIEQFGNMIPVILDGRTLVPLRSVFETLGAEVSWDSSKREASVEYEGKKAVVSIDEKEGFVDGKSFIMDVPAKIINDSTMIPIRAIAEGLGLFVGWNNSSREVSINTPEYEDKLNAEKEEKKSEKITILWDQVTNKDASNTAEKRKVINGLDVISPTWFSLSDDNGNISDIASIDYVNWAHEQGYEVWALFSNDFNKSRTHNVLSSPEKRTKVINTILSLAQKYNLDGINIDFESVAVEDGEYYLQFIKEITPALKENNLVVSVDMYIPTKYTAHYKMADVGKIVDYVIIMAYDEHWSTSPESGSVASIGWVDTAMKNACELVENDKLIMGVPFYTRRWAEETSNGQTKVSSVSMKMQEAFDILAENNAQIVWNEECGQYYGEYTTDNVVRKIWLEDEKSIEEKMKVAQKYGVKGIAAWKRGHERDSVWDVINNYF